MSRPYSTQFLKGRATPDPPTKEYIVPAGFRAVVRSIVAISPTTVEQYAFIIAYPGNGDTYLYRTTESAPWYINLQMHQVVTAGNKIQAYCSIGEIYVGIGGYLLLDP